VSIPGNLCRPQELEKTRAGLRERFTSSPLCDGPAFVRQLEGVYRGLWEDWLEAHNGEPGGGGHDNPLPAAADVDDGTAVEDDRGQAGGGSSGGEEQSAACTMPSASGTSADLSGGAPLTVDGCRSSDGPKRRPDEMPDGHGRQGSFSSGVQAGSADSNDSDLGEPGSPTASLSLSGGINSGELPGESGISECTSAGAADSNAGC